MNNNMTCVKCFSKTACNCTFLIIESKADRDKAKLIECLENVREGIEHVGLLDYINRTLEEVQK